MTKQVWLPVDGALLKKLREDAGVEVTTLARLHSLSTSQIKQLENGGDSSFYTPSIKLATGRKLLMHFGADIQPLEKVPDPDRAQELETPAKAVHVTQATDVELENVAITERAFHESTPQRSISLMWNQRSVDTFLGLPFNIASYGLLLEIIAKMVNMVPDQLVGNLGDTHLYLNHINAANEQIGHKYSLDERRAMVTQEMFNEIYNGGDPSTLSHSEIDQWGIPRGKDREPFQLPKLEINSGNENWHLLEVDEIINTFDPDFTFKVKGYKSHPSIKAPLSN